MLSNPVSTRFDLRVVAEVVVVVVVPPSVSASLPPSEPAEPLAREEDPWRGATPSAARGEWLRGDRWPRRLLRGLWDRLDRGDLDLRRRDTRGDTVCRRVPDPALSAGGAAAPAALLWSFTRPTPAPAALAVVASAGVASMSLTDRRGRVRPACGSAPLLPRGDMPRLGWRCTGAVAASVGSRAASCGTPQNKRRQPTLAARHHHASTRYWPRGDAHHARGGCERTS